MSAAVSVSGTMHPELVELVAASLKLAIRKLRENHEAPLFAAVLDEHGKPLGLNIELHPEYDAPRSVAGNVELLRAAIRETETSGGVFCAPVLIPKDDGTWLDAIELHADHVADPCAYKIRTPYAFDDTGQLLGGRPYPPEESDDLIFPR